LSNLSAGSYGLTIEDESGCIPFTSDIEVPGPMPFRVVVDTFYQDNQVCYEYQINGGIAPYQVFWNREITNQNPICFPEDEVQILFEVRDDLGCEQSFIVWDLSTSADVQAFYALDVNIFPNPVREVLHIQNQSTVPISFEVFHISGQKWDEGKLTTPTFSYPMSQFPPGIYVFRFTDALGQVKYREVIKQ